MTAHLLANARVCADVPTADLKRARHFYEATLGLKALKIDDERGVYYEAGGGTMLNLYVRPVSPAVSTIATFLVEDIEEVMSGLRSRDVSFEEYDKPDLKTKNGLFKDRSGFKVSWFKDPDGNILSLEQLPAE